MSKPRYALIATLLLTLTAPVAAQRGDDSASAAPAPQYEPQRIRPGDRHGFGFSFNYGQPTGEFRNFVDQGFGADGYYRFALDRYGIMSLRVGGQFLIYGNETRRMPLSSTVGNLILVDVETYHGIAGIGGGIELAAPTPAVRPYVFGQLGSSYFFTESSVEGSDDAFDFAHTTNFSDWVFSRQIGAGLQVPIGRNRVTAVHIDVGATFTFHDDASYLREGSIVEVGQGNFVFRPIRSEANLVTYRVGVALTTR